MQRLKKSEKYIRDAHNNKHICCGTCKHYINDGSDKCSKTGDKRSKCFLNFDDSGTQFINGELWVAKYNNKYVLWELKIINDFKLLNDDLFKI